MNIIRNRIYFFIISIHLFILFGCGGSKKSTLRHFSLNSGSIINSFVLDNVITKEEYKELKALFKNETELPDSIFSEWVSSEFPDIKIDTVKHLDSIKIYIETSASMKGFVDANDRYPNGKWNFKKIIPDLVTNSTNIKGAGVKLFTITDAPKIYKKDYQKEFRLDISNGRIFENKSTELNDIFASIINNNSKNQVSLLISDCVLDFKGKLKNSSNKNFMASSISQDLNKKDGYSAIVFQYYTDFNGTFYFTEENQQPFRGRVLKNRPFYIWVIGSKGAVKEFMSKSSIPDGFNNFQAYGLPNLALKKYELLSKVKKGRVSIHSFNELYLRGKSPYTFVVALHLNDFYTKSGAYLNNKILIKEEYLNPIASFLTINELENDKKYKRSIGKLRKMIYEKGYDNFITTNIDNSIDENITLHYSYPYPEWITKSNIDSDINVTTPEELEKKTFVFSTVCEAFEKSLGKSSLFEYNIKLIKK